MNQILPILISFILSSVFAQAATPLKTDTIPPTEAPEISAPRAIVVDYQTGRILYEKDAHKRCAVASTQKLLTALCVMENGNTEKNITIIKSDTWVVPTKLGILPGQTYTRRRLVGALLVKSGNDVARALARSVSGSETSFADLMNKKAKRLKMKNSHFMNPHGLTAEGQYSTAFDMAICAREALNSEVLRGIVKTKGYYFTFSNGKKTYVDNTNALLKKIPYCHGMKTGTTKASGRCLISSGSLGGRTTIVVVLGATSSNVWKDSEKLLRWSLERPAVNKTKLP